MFVATLFEQGEDFRSVYLPEGEGINYFTNEEYTGGWHNIENKEMAVVLMVKKGVSIPLANHVQHTGEIDWKELSTRRFGGVEDKINKLIVMQNLF